MSGNLPSEWPANGYAMFISHSSFDKVIGASIKSELEKYGIYGFLAHEDIEPAEPWQKVIRAALGEMHSLLALSSKNFNESHWCQQEVGYALGAQKPYFTIRLDEPPRGFAGEIQALTLTDAGAEKAVECLLKTMLKHDQARVTSALVDGLVSARRYDDARKVAKFLLSKVDTITAIDAARIRTAMAENSQVRDATLYYNQSMVEHLDNWINKCCPVEDIEDPFES